MNNEKPPSKFFLVVRKGDQRTMHALNLRPVLVGRDLASVKDLPDGEHIVIRDGSISRWQFTIHPRIDHAEVEANPKSPNPLLKNGAVQTRARFFPGEFIELGPYRFEFEAEVEIPVPIPDALPPDPAGVVDVKLIAEEFGRVAPRWRAHDTAGEGLDEVAGDLQKPKQSLGRRLMTPIAAVALLGIIGAWMLMDRQRPQEDTGDQPKIPDVFADLRQPECANKQACLNLAKGDYTTAMALLVLEPNDLVSRYKIARGLHQAMQALKGQEDQLPDLKPRYEEARRDFETSLSDVRFRYQRAYEHDDVRGQLNAVEAMRSICKEYRHAFCEELELDYKRLKE